MLRSASSRAWRLKHVRECSASSSVRCLSRTVSRTNSNSNTSKTGSFLDGQSFPPPNSSFFTSTGSSTSTSSSNSTLSIPPLSSIPSSVSTFGAPPKLLSQYTSLPPTPLSLKALLALSPSASSPPPRSQVHESALFTSRELPIRLAKRVAAFRALPFIVGANPHIGRVARLYAESFEILASWRELLEKDGQGEEERFVDSLRELVERHRDNVPTLARGFLECSQYMSSKSISSFLDEAIHARIGIRLIAEQHLSLASSFFRSESAAGPSSSPSSSSSTSSYDSRSDVQSPGTIHTDLRPYSVLRHVGQVVTALCQSTLGAAPELLIEGHKDATYVGVPVHLEYVLTELLKNSFRASVELRDRVDPKGEVRPVKVTIAKSKRHVSLRIRDRGGGIHPKDLDRVFSYAFTTAGREPGSSESTSSSSTSSTSSTSSSSSWNDPYSLHKEEDPDNTSGKGGIGGMNPTLDGLTLGAPSGTNLQSGLGTLAGLGYGLPMGRIYATYFGQGAELGVVSLWGEGCDTFVRMPADPIGWFSNTKA
ncbi:unnamed protein product [Sympodiomycopsis kandeliae]